MEGCIWSDHPPYLRFGALTVGPVVAGWVSLDEGVVLLSNLPGLVATRRARRPSDAGRSLAVAVTELKLEQVGAAGRLAAAASARSLLCPASGSCALLLPVSYADGRTRPSAVPS